MALIPERTPLSKSNPNTEAWLGKSSTQAAPKLNGQVSRREGTRGGPRLAGKPHTRAAAPLSFHTERPGVLPPSPPPDESRGRTAPRESGRHSRALPPKPPARPGTEDPRRPSPGPHAARITSMRTNSPRAVTAVSLLPGTSPRSGSASPRGSYLPWSARW